MSIENELKSMGFSVGREEFLAAGHRVKIEEKIDGDVLLSSMIGNLSEIQETNIPNAVIAFLDANLHIQPASVGIAVGRHDISVRATVLVDRDHVSDKPSLRRALNALEMAIRTASVIMTKANEVAVG